MKIELLATIPILWMKCKSDETMGENSEIIVVTTLGRHSLRKMMH